MTDNTAIIQPYFPSELLSEIKERRAVRHPKNKPQPLVLAEITRGAPRSPDPRDGALLVLNPSTETPSLEAQIESGELTHLDLLTIASDQSIGIELERNRKAIKRYQPHVLIEGTAEDAQLARRYLPHYHDARDLGDRLRYFEPIELRSLTAVHGQVEGSKIDVNLPRATSPEAINLNTERDSFVWLASFVRLYRPNRILEIGRGPGNSLVALTEYLDRYAQLDSYDIVPCGKVVDQANVEIFVYDGKVETINYEPYDFIFVDLDMDMGLERRIFRKMQHDGYQGISVWNGIRDPQRPRHQAWWNNLEAKKLDVSPTNRPTGTGLVWLDS